MQLSSYLLYRLSFGSAQRSTLLSIPTTASTTDWPAPGWCGVESPFVEIAETVTQWQEKDIYK
jgi:hypothetical protein